MSVTQSNQILYFDKYPVASCYLEPQGNLTSDLRTHRIRLGADRIHKKIIAEWRFAQNHVIDEPTKEFQYFSTPELFKGNSYTESIAGYEVGVCHYIGERETMEDEHLTTFFTLKVQDMDYVVPLFGIFDGHGGNMASDYLKKNLESKLHDTLDQFCSAGLCDEVIWNALKITFVRLHEEFKEPISGSTATVAAIPVK